MKDLKCLLGIHTAKYQDIHCTEMPNKRTFSAGIIIKCSNCNYSKLYPELPTTIYVPDKFLPEE